MICLLLITLASISLASCARITTQSYDLSTELLPLWGKIDGSTATIPLTSALYSHLGSGGSPPLHNTTSEAYKNLIDGKSDLIFVTYPSENEFNMAQQKGIEFEIIPIVKDGLVFLVNAENPVDNVTLTMLRDIYTGKVTNWKSLSGQDELIAPYQRTTDSGSQTLLLKLVMDGQEPMNPPTEWIATEMGWLVEIVSDYNNARKAIGYELSWRFESEQTI